MAIARRLQRIYDHRLKELVHETGDIELAVRHGVPRSTARGWLRSRRDVVTLDVLETTGKELRQEILALRRRNEKLRAILRVVVVALKVSGFSLANCRIPDREGKTRLLRAIERSRAFLPFRSMARVLGVSLSRYYSWRRSQEGCDLDDRSSCPKTSPHQLTPDEVQTIREMVTSPEHRHVPTGTLAVLAGRLGKVFAVIRLLDSRRAYVHAVIDNFSRWILA